MVKLFQKLAGFGAEPQGLDLKKEIGVRDLKVLHLISGGDKGGAKTHVFALLSALIEEVDIKVVCFMEGVFYQEIQNMPIPSVLIKQRFRYDLTVVKKLVRLVREERYNLIHAHGARANFIAVFLKRHIKIPIITTVHSDYRMDFTQNLYKKLLFTELNAVSLRFMDYYIGVSDNFKNMLIERNFPGNKIYSVYNAIDFDKEIKFVPKNEFLEKYKIPKDKTLVGIIGRFDKVKGHDVFVKACAEVLKKNKDIVFLLAGEGDEQNNLMGLAEKLGIEKNIMFLGFINDIFSFINAIDVNVLSSHSESFPYVLLEGAILKKATVSTAVGGIPDLIKEDKTGYLAEAGNHEELAEKILKFVENPEKREELGSNLHDFAKTNFSKESMKNRHIEIYEDVLKRQKDENKLFDVILSGYYGFNNSGDEAILSAIISALREEKPDIKILVLSKQPVTTAERYNVFSLNRYDFLKIPRYFKSARVFINGGGSLIQDITSTHSLVYYTFLMHTAKRYGQKVMLYSNGIGPITKDYNRKTAVNALSICDNITLREPESFAELEKLGVKNVNTALSADPTLRTQKAPDEEIDAIWEREGIDKNKKYFALSFRQWRYNDPDFVNKISKVINFVHENYGFYPLFIPMQYPNDQIISNEIIDKTKCKAYVLSSEYSVRELLGIINRMEFVIAMRLHTLIYAVSVNIPVLGIVYDPKIKSFLDYIKQDRYVDTRNLDVNEMIEKIKGIEADYDNIKISIEQEVAKLKTLCYNDPKIAVSLLE